MKKIFVPVLSALLVSAEALPFLTTAAAAVLLLSPSQVEALPIDRQVGRMQARDSRQAGRQTSRARRRGFYGLPGGAVPFAYGGYRYYRVVSCAAAASWLHRHLFLMMPTAVPPASRRHSHHRFCTCSFSLFRLLPSDFSLQTL